MHWSISCFLTFPLIPGKCSQTILLGDTVSEAGDNSMTSSCQVVCTRILCTGYPQIKRHSVLPSDMIINVIFVGYFLSLLEFDCTRSDRLCDGMLKPIVTNTPSRFRLLGVLLVYSNSASRNIAACEYNAK
ncbi:hypothetical protein GOODEAATRI_008509 [Goodea atripinnis]|uniref:Secreted protein n=1 Tax=Goodea atripinnis TaxID=208336 RepID=A0ABV0P2K3_9TELE